MKVNKKKNEETQEIKRINKKQVKETKKEKKPSYIDSYNNNIKEKGDSYVSIYFKSFIKLL